MTVLVTGVAGFIGMHVAEQLLRGGVGVLGIDNLNAYYDPRLKRARLAQLEKYTSFRFVRADLADRDGIGRIFDNDDFDAVVHLGAQAGVRHSLENPHAYVDSNITGTLNVLEGCRHHPVKHLVYASSSSVFGANSRIPFRVTDTVDHPVSLYAATKRATELMAHSYSHLFGIPTTGLRFFTVYGPWGRPDMAYWEFTKRIIAGEPIEVFNEGLMKRDFTYIDDVVEGVLKVLDQPASSDSNWSSDSPTPASSCAPFRIFNIGNQSPVELSAFIDVLERSLGVTAKRELRPLQPGDVEVTCADVDDLVRAVGYSPATSIEVGIPRFVHWYQTTVPSILP